MLLTGIKPPDEIIDIDKLNESKLLRSINLSKAKSKSVNEVYIKNIFKDCLKVSE